MTKFFEKNLFEYQDGLQKKKIFFKEIRDTLLLSYSSELSKLRGIFCMSSILFDAVLDMMFWRMPFRARSLSEMFREESKIIFILEKNKFLLHLEQFCS